MPCIYIIGSLRNSRVPEIADQIRALGYDAFDNWYAAGERADDSWQAYEIGRGRSFREALHDHAARHVFDYDLFHLNRSHAGVMILPTGKSGHLELGYLVGQGKPGFTLLADKDPERYDVMAQFSTITMSVDDLLKALQAYHWPKLPTIPFLHMTDAVWLTALLDGKGDFCMTNQTPQIALQMTDEDVVRRAAKILGVKVDRYPPVWSCRVTGLKAVEMMRILQPGLGARRRAQIVNIIQEWLEQKGDTFQDRNFWARMFRL